MIDNSVIAAIIIALVLVIISCSTIKNNKPDPNLQYLYGYWEASDEFCIDSGLKNASMFVNSDESTMYIIMEKDTHFLLNKTISYDLKKSKSTVQSCVYDIEFADDVNPLLKKCSLRLDIKNGMIAFHDEDTILLTLYKNCKATAGVV